MRSIFSTSTLVLATTLCCSAFRAPMMMRSPSETLRPFREGRALKIISGLTNFDAELVEKVARATAQGGATHLDIACDANLVRIAKAAAPRVRLMVSAIDPEAFAPAIEAGADMLELGNFDAFYDEKGNFRLTFHDILDMTSRTQALHPFIPLSVTIPHTLEMDEQAALAQALQKLGVDVIQTEGSPSVSTMATGPQALIEKASPALAAAYILSRAAPKTPVMASSDITGITALIALVSGARGVVRRITEVTAPMALVSGARGVGVGSAISKLSSEAEMATRVRMIARSMGLLKSFHH